MTLHRRHLAVCGLLLGLAGCGSAETASNAPSPSATAVSTSATSSPLRVSDNTWTDSIDATAVPLGDGKLTMTPTRGALDTCLNVFTGGGSQVNGPWLDTAHATWNATAKLAVSGAHTWPSAAMHVTLSGTLRTIATNDLPIGLTTGTFPIAGNDPAYQYDRNPNSISAQSISLMLPAKPAVAVTPSCTGLGPIGVTTDGVLLFNALDAGGRDAGAHEVQDRCGGHPDPRGAYHYHAISSCLAPATASTTRLVGYALDGFGIYAEWNAQGSLPANADLDACHGRSSTVSWDGTTVTMYHYDVTLEYPYTVGCYRGTPAQR